jgi:hypothetical protein
MQNYKDDDISLKSLDDSSQDPRKHNNNRQQHMNSTSTATMHIEVRSRYNDSRDNSAINEVIDIPRDTMTGASILSESTATYSLLEPDNNPRTNTYSTHHKVIFNPKRNYKYNSNLPRSETLWSVAGNDLLSLEEKYTRIMQQSHTYQTQRQNSDYDDNESMDVITNEELSYQKNIMRAGTMTEPDSNPPPPVKVQYRGPSKSRAKLGNLNNFVMNHANRKITQNWDIIEDKFTYSKTVDIVMEKNEDGISVPVKYKTLPLDTLVLSLCSPQVRMKHKEVSTLFTNLGIPQDVTDRACRIAAVRVVNSSSSNMMLHAKCVREIDKLAPDTLPMVRVTLLLEKVFSSDPKVREKEMAAVEGIRIERTARAMEEARLKKENMEKIESRKKTAVTSFEESCRTVHYSRGPMNDTRMEHLMSIISFAQNVIFESRQEKGLTLDPFVVELLGAQMFPSFVHESESLLKSQKKTFIEERRSRVNNIPIANIKKNSKKVYSNKTYKIDLVGPPTLIALLRQAVAQGKGLYGANSTTVMELIQAYCVTRITAFYRGYTRRWKYRRARRTWRHMNNYVKSLVFLAWANDVKKVTQLKKYCLRKVVAWRFITSKNLATRNMFRTCFWPFYVWRRMSCGIGRAREKTKYLTTRVLPTLVMLRVFGAWKRYFNEEADMFRPAIAYYNKIRRKHISEILWWWVMWKRRRKALRRAWLSNGLMMATRKNDACVRGPFQVWYVSIQLKKRTSAFVRKHSVQFRSFLLSGKHPHLPPIKTKIRSQEDEDRIIIAAKMIYEQDLERERTMAARFHTHRAMQNLRALRRMKTTNDKDAESRVPTQSELMVSQFFNMAIVKMIKVLFICLYRCFDQH